MKLVANSKKPGKSRFKQQQLPAWQPILTPRTVIIAFFVIGIIFIPVGVAFYITSDGVQETELRYDDICGAPNPNTTEPCVITFDDLDMKPPVYLYYKLTNFFQNHRRYVRSRNDAQLAGDADVSAGSLSDCSPLDKINNRPILPCGLIANSQFNDSFMMHDANGTAVPLRSKGIAWKSDVDRKFNNPGASSIGAVRVIPDFENEDFIVWMRVAALPTFKKLHRIIDVELKGNFTLMIMNNYPVEGFKGKKFVVLSETSFLGGKNQFLGIAYLVVGGLAILQAIVFLIAHLVNGRKLGDTRYLAWNKGN